MGETHQSSGLHLLHSLVGKGSGVNSTLPQVLEMNHKDGAKMVAGRVDTKPAEAIL